VLRRHRVQVEIEAHRAEARVEIEAVVLEAERLVELTRRSLPVREALEHIVARSGAAERLEQRAHELFPRAPDRLSAEFHHLVDALEPAQHLHLAVER